MRWWRLRSIREKAKEAERQNITYRSCWSYRPRLRTLPVSRIAKKKKDKQIKTVFGGDKKRGGGRQNRLSGTDKENHQVAFERATRTAELKSVLRMQTIKTKTSTSMQMWRNVKTMKMKHCMWENVSVTPLKGRKRPSIGQQSCCSAHLKFHQKKRK